MLLKVLGLFFLIAGIILVLSPDLFNDISYEGSNPYQLIEKRVRWGLIIGLGLFLFFHLQWTYWRITLLAFLIAIITGIILARLFGLILDGFFFKQLLWLTIELGTLFLFYCLYRKLKP